jgi:hypothetical protein
LPHLYQALPSGSVPSLSAGAVGLIALLRVQVEIMGSQKCRIVGKSQRAMTPT